MRKLKGLENHISISIVHPLMLENGWTFSDGPGVIKDSLFNSDYLYQVYLKADPNYSGRVTVPVLWDKQTNTIVNNESAEIMRMFNTASEPTEEAIATEAARLEDAPPLFTTSNEIAVEADGTSGN